MDRGEETFISELNYYYPPPVFYSQELKKRVTDAEVLIENFRKTKNRVYWKGSKIDQT